jgi:hypothetical protein
VAITLGAGKRLIPTTALVVALVGCGLGPATYILEVPPEVPHQLTPDQVADIASAEAAARDIGRPPRPFRIVRITLVPPNREVEVVNVDGTRLGGGVVSETTTWAVLVEGTIDLDRRRCIDLAVLVIDDGTGRVSGLLPRGPEQPCT